MLTQDIITTGDQCNSLDENFSFLILGVNEIYTEMHQSLTLSRLTLVKNLKVGKM
jgi:hypothetical protein